MNTQNTNYWKENLKYVGILLSIWFLVSFCFSILFKDYLDLDKKGYIITKPGTSKTSLEGVFASGDIQDQRYMQAITAAGSGCMAAIDAEHYLESIQ